MNAIIYTFHEHKLFTKNVHEAIFFSCSWTAYKARFMNAIIYTFHEQQWFTKKSSLTYIFYVYFMSYTRIIFIKNLVIKNVEAQIWEKIRTS